MTHGVTSVLVRRWAGAACLACIAACAPPADKAVASTSSGEWHAFEGTWSASGNRQTLELGQDRQATIFRLTGSLLLAGEQKLGVGFRAQVIGLSDTGTGMLGRCIWTDEKGDRVYSELKGDAVGPGGRIVGTIVGGTGRWAGVTGEYTFRWQHVISAENDEVSGRVVDLKGRVREGAATLSGKSKP
jgi:hypothetical protein